MYLGDFVAGATIYFKWGTVVDGSGSVTRATNGTIRVYKNGSDTQRSSANGITDTEDFDGLTGFHHLTIDLSDNTDAGFYAAGSDYMVMVTGMVIGGLTLNVPLCSFSIENRNDKADVREFGGAAGTFSGGRPEVNVSHWLGTAAATPTVAGVPEVDITHYLGTAAQGASGRPQVDVELWLGSAPNALISGRVDITIGAVQTGALTAAGFSAGAIDAAALAADAGTEIATAVWASGTRVLTANTNLNDPTAAAIADAVWDEDATGHQTGGTFGQAIGDPGADTTTIYQSVVTDAAGTNVAADIIAIKAQTAAIETDTAEIGAAGAGLTVLATQASVNTIDDFLDTEVAAIKAKTDNLPADPADASDIAALIDALPTAVENASAVRTELATELGRVDAAISTRATPAQVNAEVVDALATDTYAEPGQGTPGATISLSAKIGYIYKAWRNRSTMTASEYALYGDDAVTKDQEAAVSDNGTTFERGEVATGA